MILEDFRNFGGVETPRYATDRSEGLKSKFDY